MLVVVGGHSRNIGKTSVVAAIVRALPQAAWTAMKITQFGQGICSSSGHPCECSLDPQCPYSIAQETAPNRSDTGRFLAAGASRSFWVRTAAGRLSTAVPAIREVWSTSPNLIVESNSILEFLAPDLYLVVLDFSQPDFKPSSRRFLDRADACVVVAPGAAPPAWRDVPPEAWENKPRFLVSPPAYMTPSLAAFVQSRLDRYACQRIRVDPR